MCDDDDDDDDDDKKVTIGVINRELNVEVSQYNPLHQAMTHSR